MERRTFLKGGLGLAGAAAIEACKTPKGQTRIEAVYPSRQTGAFERSETHSGAAWEHQQELSREEREKLQQLSHAANLFLWTVRRELRIYRSEDCSLEQFAQLRQRFAATGLKQRFEESAEILLRSRDRSLYDQQLEAFTWGSAQGCLYKNLAFHAQRLGISDPFLHDQNYYAARVRDYVPSGEAIWSQDIDPRNKPTENANWLHELGENPGWSGARRRAAFKELAANPALQEQAKRADLTLAEYFSLLKAVFKERLNEAWAGRTPESVEVITARLLATRDTFLHTNLADETTEQAIVFYGRDRQNMHRGNEETEWQSILESAGVERRRIFALGTNRDHNSNEVRQRLFQLIEDSHGKTFVAFDAHGRNDVLGIDDVDGEAIFVRDLGRALVTRLQRIGQPDAIVEMTIFVEACFSYEFATNLQTEIMEQWRRLPRTPFAAPQIKFPTMVTAVQETSQAVHTSKSVVILAEQTRGIRADGALTGQRLLQIVGPASYATGNDLTVFAPETGTEFAGRGRGRTSSATA